MNRVLIKLSGFGYNGSNGIPGKTIAPSLNARSDKRTISTGGEFGYFFKGLGAINLTCSYQNRRTDYRDLVGSTPYLTQYFEEEKALGLSIKGNEWKHLNAELRGSLREQRLEGKDNLRPDYALGIVTRDIYQLGYSLRYRNGVSPLNIEMAISGNTDITDGENYWAQSAQTSIWFDYAIKPGISLSYGRSYRLPGLAELNWKEDVFVIANPDLRPEQSNQKLFGISGISLTFVHKYKVVPDAPF